MTERVSSALHKKQSGPKRQVKTKAALIEPARDPKEFLPSYFQENKTKPNIKNQMRVPKGLNSCSDRI